MSRALREMLVVQLHKAVYKDILYTITANVTIKPANLFTGIVTLSTYSMIHRTQLVR